MVFSLVRSEVSIRDLEVIFRHLIGSYIALGDAVDEAILRATMRMQEIDRDMHSIAGFPYQGTLFSTRKVAGLRYVTKNRAIFYFEVNELHQAVHVLAVFFGGQDHQRHMLKRLGALKER